MSSLFSVSIPPFVELVSPAEMQCGDIGIVRKWSGNNYFGDIVTKVSLSGRAILISVGYPNRYWDNPCGWPMDDPNKCGIEILTKGSTITINE